MATELQVKHVLSETLVKTELLPAKVSHQLVEVLIRPEPTYSPTNVSHHLVETTLRTEQIPSKVSHQVIEVLTSTFKNNTLVVVGENNNIIVDKNGKILLYNRLWTKR